MQFVIDGPEQDDRIYAWFLEQGSNGDIHLKVRKKGDSVSWYVFTVRSKDGEGWLDEGLSTKFGLPLGENGTIKLAK